METTLWHLELHLTEDGRTTRADAVGTDARTRV
jgi:hypothetical protein